MKKIITLCLFSLFIIGPYQLAVADEVTTPETTPPEAALQTNIQPATDIANTMDDENKKKEEEEKKEADKQKALLSAEKSAPAEAAIKSAKSEPNQQPAAPAVSAMVPEDAKDEPRVIQRQEYPRYRERVKPFYERRLNVHTNAPAQKPIVIQHDVGNDFSQRIQETPREKVIVHTPNSDRRANVVVVENRGSFTSNLKSGVQAVTDTSAIVYDEQSFKQRAQKERALRLRELAIKERVLSQRERAALERDWYHRQLRVREWDDLDARDQELRYLMWREQQMSRYYWRDNNRLCRYVTYYRTGVRVNKKVTICDRRRGHYSCYHPKRYFIYPVTRLVCYPLNDRRLIGTVIRPFPY